MTIGVDDQGQPFEVRTKGYPDEGWQVFGWAGSERGAVDMARAALLAPGCTAVEYVHRRESIAKGARRADEAT